MEQRRDYWVLDLGRDAAHPTSITWGFCAPEVWCVSIRGPDGTLPYQRSRCGRPRRAFVWLGGALRQADDDAVGSREQVDAVADACRSGDGGLCVDAEAREVAEPCEVSTVVFSERLQDALVGAEPWLLEGGHDASG